MTNENIGNVKVESISDEMNVYNLDEQIFGFKTEYHSVSEIENEITKNFNKINRFKSNHLDSKIANGNSILYVDKDYRISFMKTGQNYRLVSMSGIDFYKIFPSLMNDYAKTEAFIPGIFDSYDPHNMDPDSFKTKIFKYRNRIYKIRCHNAGHSNVEIDLLSIFY